MFIGERFRWLFDSARLTPRQRFGYLIGIIIGIGVASFITSRYLHGELARFASLFVGSLIGAVIGLLSTGFSPFARRYGCTEPSESHAPNELQMPPINGS